MQMCLGFLDLPSQFISATVFRLLQGTRQNLVHNLGTLRIFNITDFTKPFKKTSKGGERNRSDFISMCGLENGRVIFAEQIDFIGKAFSRIIGN